MGFLYKQTQSRIFRDLRIYSRIFEVNIADNAISGALK